MFLLIAMLVLGNPTEAEWIVPACDTREQIQDVANQGSNTKVIERFEHYFNTKNANNEAVCGLIVARIKPVKVIQRLVIDGKDVTVFEFQAEQYPLPLFGITNHEVIMDGHVSL